jgi:hypothetical protein
LKDIHVMTCDDLYVDSTLYINHDNYIYNLGYRNQWYNIDSFILKKFKEVVVLFF